MTEHFTLPTSISIRPAGRPPMLTSKKTLGFDAILLAMLNSLRMMGKSSRVWRVFLTGRELEGPELFLRVRGQFRRGNTVLQLKTFQKRGVSVGSGATPRL